MQRTVLPLLATVALLAACQEEVADEMNPSADSVVVTMQPPAPIDAVTGTLLNPETATVDQLVAVGVDSATATAIVDARPIDDMLEVDAILAQSMDETQREEIYRRLFRPLDLNSATGEEIQLIPGVDDRMQHEFEEYRPYTDMEQFRREIGKYVDQQEVERLASYVTIRSQ